MPYVQNQPNDAGNVDEFRSIYEQDHLIVGLDSILLGYQKKIDLLTDKKIF